MLIFGNGHPVRASGFCTSRHNCTQSCTPAPPAPGCPAGAAGPRDPIPAAAGAYLFNLGRIFDSETTKIENAFPAESTRPQQSVPGGAAAGDAPGAGPGAAPAAAGAPAPDSGRPLNILLIGSDSRGATAEEAMSGAGSDQRADSLMLVHIPAGRSKIYSISLMRDLWVGIPDHGNAKINAALAFGGVPLMVQTVESIFGQRIDHVAMIGFDGFVGMTDALGGVDVDVPAPFVSYVDQIAFTAGPNPLDGKQALEFVRERYAFADGDYQRVRNQQAFVKALLGKNLSADSLLTPFKVHNAVSALAPFISVDGGLDAAALASLAVELRDVRPRDMLMFTLPTRGIGTSTDGQSIVLPDPGAIGALSAALAADTLGDYVAANGLEGGN